MRTYAAERREQYRSEVNTSARVKVLNPLSSAGPASAARVYNRSSVGLRLTVPRQIFAGALVQILIPGEVILGEVRYCSPAGAEFDIGVRIVESL